ncbi:short chain dehydrogenase reductase family [Colletotrichum karsti]|uniref:Short chain dehydrogenase reductase family n=1 Tax=Colletotrichum karsti TaxID=1095194 RepID=A0A9P6I6G7_9PEZI|nr:short chain dehydrogenase reductase family [Colletotrichum karsti]KAF9876879.1 short chain dehydrogenase reductase family [Colletotrichum karsti]
MSPQFKYLNKLRSSRVLIIGGSSGLGYAAAEASIEHGATVILVSSNATKLSAAADRLRSTYTTLLTTPDQITTHTIDLSDLANLRSNLTALLDIATLNGEHKINHVIYTADLAPPLPPLPQTKPDDIHAAFALRAHAPIILAGLLKESERYVLHSPDTSLTLTNGSSSHRPMPGWAVADAAAGSMEGLVRGLACDLAPARVNLVSSGPVTTELFQQLPAETVELFRSKCLTGRLGRPEDVVEAYLYLMKDGFVTGATIFTEGGRILAP